MSYQQLNTPSGIKYYLGYFDPVLITFNAAIYTCWPTENSSNILTGSTVTLTDNKIYLPLTFISKGSVKLGINYSIIARQYSLSEGRYNYLQKMKKIQKALVLYLMPNLQNLQETFTALAMLQNL